MVDKINIASCQDDLEFRTKELLKELKDHLDLIKVTSNTGAYANNSDKRKNILNSVKSALYNSVAASSAHGFPNIINSKRRSNQIMWALFFLLYACLCSWFIFNSVQGYLNYDVVSKIKIKRENKLEFPTIYFCTDLKQKLFVLDATFDGLSIVSTLKGINELGQNCYIFNAVNNSSLKTLFHQDEIGRTAGLQVNFYLEKVGTSHVKIFIGEKRVLPEYRGINKIVIEQGKSSDISLSKLVSINMPEPYNSCLNNLDSESSFDSKLYRLTLNNNHTYRQANCYDICAFMYVSNVCNCTAGKVFENANHTKDCLDGSDVTAEKCKNRVLKRLNLTKECNHFCPLECSSVFYKFNSQTLDFRSDLDLVTRFREVLTLNGDTGIANLSHSDLKAYLSTIGISVNIFFLELQYEELTEAAKMTQTDLVSNIGGTMGNRVFNLINLIAK